MCVDKYKNYARCNKIILINFIYVSQWNADIVLTCYVLSVFSIKDI